MPKAAPLPGRRRSGVQQAPAAGRGAKPAPRHAPVAAGLLALQLASGNRAVGALLGSHPKHPRPTVQRGDPPVGGTQAPAGPSMDFASMNALTLAGVDLSGDDWKVLAKQFPMGLTLGQEQPLILGMRFGDRIDGIRATGFSVRSAVPMVEQGVEAWIFQVGKGRSILVSSIGGGSVLMDAGSFQATSLTAPSVQRLSASIRAVTSGPAQVPGVIKVSHSDTDHYNGVRALLTDAAFSATAVEVAMEQVRSAGAGAWAGMSLTMQPTQRTIEINVTGGGGVVHVNRVVIDNMELTEFRSVAAHQALGRTDITTYNRNRTSPVVVVRDLVSGQRMLFTADAEGRQFDEIVNAVGDAGMRRILGAEGHNLKLMEAPHHYGKQAGADATGLLNMLQLAFESGEGSMRLVGQTTQSFAAKPSSTYSFLDASGAAPERIERDPSPQGEMQATRARGSELARVTLDMSGVQRAIEILQANDTTLRQAYERLAEFDRMVTDTAAVGEALRSSNAPAPLNSSVAATGAEVERLRTELRTATNQVWDRMRAAATAEGGVHGSADMTQVTAALGQVASRLPAQQEDLTKARNDLETHRSGLTLYSRLSYNAVQLLNALQADDIEGLFRARAEHNDLVQAARAALGPAAVHEHVTAAWAATRAEWTPEKFEARSAELSARFAQQEMSAEFRSLLSETLSRQMQLNKVVAEAEQAGRQVYGPGGTIKTPTSARVGAGILAAIEIVRVGLECYSQYRAGSAAKDLAGAQSARMGIATMQWWMRLGLLPIIALGERGIMHTNRYKIVYEADQGLARRAALSDTKLEGVPDFDIVMVTGLDGGELRGLLNRAVAELATLEDWNSFNNSCPAGPAFRRYDDGWGVRLWSPNDEKYGYIRTDDIAPGIGAYLDRLHVALDKAQEGKLAADVAAPDAGSVKSVKDTAWIFGSDRRVYVYNKGGGEVRYDFDSDRPRFLKVDTVGNPWRVDGPQVKVQAADLATYKVLSSYWWAVTGGRNWDAYGNTYRDASVTPNVHGWAYVYPSQLIEAD